MASRACRIVANGGARHLGIEPSDTVHILLAVANDAIIRDENGVEVKRYEGVDLAIDGRDFAISVDWTPDGKVSVLKTEPLDPWITHKKSP
jgi:hypothetical protein